MSTARGQEKLASGKPSAPTTIEWFLGRPGLGPAILAAFVAVAHVAFILIVFANTREDDVLRGFLRQSYQEGGRVLDGAIPYRDFLFEYPPGTLLFMIAPRVAATGFLEFRRLFFLEAALLDALIVVLLVAIARNARLPAVRTVFLYSLAIIAIGPLVAYRLDLAPAALTALAVLAWQRDRPAVAAAAIAAGTATKIYPLLLLPPLLVDQWLCGQARRLPRVALTFLVTLTVWLSPVLFAGPTGLARAIQFQSGRHLQVESIWATPPLLSHLLTGFPLQIAALDRAQVVLGPGDTLGQAGPPALIVATLAIYWCWWRLRLSADARKTALLLGTVLLIFGEAVLNKVLSPQYLLWVMPALAVVPLHSRLVRIAMVAFWVALPITQWIYPLHYGELVRLFAPNLVVLLAIRNGLLVLAFVLLFIAFWRLGMQTRRDIMNAPSF